jgi:hypothetical protein
VDSLCGYDDSWTAPSAQEISRDLLASYLENNSSRTPIQDVLIDRMVASVFSSSIETMRRAFARDESKDATDGVSVCAQPSLLKSYLTSDLMLVRQVMEMWTDNSEELVVSKDAPRSGEEEEEEEAEETADTDTSGSSDRSSCVLREASLLKAALTHIQLSVDVASVMERWAAGDLASASSLSPSPSSAMTTMTTMIRVNRRNQFQRSVLLSPACAPAPEATEEQRVEEEEEQGKSSSESDEESRLNRRVHYYDYHGSPLACFDAFMMMAAVSGDDEDNIGRRRRLLPHLEPFLRCLRGHLAVELAASALL